MVNRGQDHANAKTDAAGALTDRRQGEVRRAVVRPDGTEVVLGKPHAGKAHLLGVGDLLQGFIDTLGFTLRGPGFGDLNLVKQAKAHRILSCGSGAWAHTTDAASGALPGRICRSAPSCNRRGGPPQALVCGPCRQERGRPAQRTPVDACEEVAGDARPLGTRGMRRVWLSYYVPHAHRAPAGSAVLSLHRTKNPETVPPPVRCI